MFTICTIANDMRQYHAMRSSFLEAGFDSIRCDYRVYDNTVYNQYEPFSVISSLSAESKGRFLIVCHQDVRIDRGAGYDELVQRLNELTEIDPNWVVAGNYGITPSGRGTGKVNDPNGTSRPGPFPQKVVSLDECFMVIRPNIPVSCTPGLYGFHLYGTDLCLNAYFSGRTCYVIDFLLTHLSGGNSSSEEFKTATANFTSSWNEHFAVAMIGTPNSEFRLSKWKSIRYLLRSTKICQMLKYFGLNYISYPAWKSILQVSIPRQSRGL